MKVEIEQVVVTGPLQVELQTYQLETNDLGPNEVLIETEYSYISTGTELANYTGKEPKVFQPGQSCTYPWNSGYANAGIVRAAGEQVDRVAVGDRVLTCGKHASAHRYDTTRLATSVPDGIDPPVVAVSRMAMTAPIVSKEHSGISNCRHG